MILTPNIAIVIREESLASFVLQSLAIYREWVISVHFHRLVSCLEISMATVFLKGVLSKIQFFNL